MNNTWLTKLMKVSIIVPTCNRSEYFPRLLKCFQQQTYVDCELLIYDDTPLPASFFDDRAEENVRYYHSPERLTIGEKRNFLIEQAQGEVIAHFDDDDYYAPQYIDFMVQLLGKDYALAKLSGWFIYQVENRFFGYWDTANDDENCYMVAPGQPVQPVFLEGKASSLTGFGFSYVYKKSVYEKVQYQAINFGEDNQFVTDCFEQGYQLHYADDPGGLVLHIIHLSNTSRAFPQYEIPGHLVSRLFGTEISEYIAS